MHLIDREVGDGAPLFLIAGPCVIENEALCMTIAEKLARLRDREGILVIFKASFDKANRTSGSSFRGPGLDDGLRILENVRDFSGLPILTDVHEIDQCEEVGQVVDMIQIPAFLSRQTDLLLAAADTGKPINVKKAQWSAAEDQRAVAEKLGDAPFTLCERGNAFGYHNLIVDFRGLPIMRQIAPVVFDATHSVQQPGGLGDRSGGDREMAKVLARAAVAVGIDGLFIETHPTPDEALSDGPNSVYLSDLDDMMARLLDLDRAVKR